MNERDTVIKNAQKNMKRIDALDGKLAGEIAAAYRRARRDLMADLVDAFGRLPDNPTPAQIQRLLGVQSLIASIEARIGELGQEMTLAVQDGIRATVEATYGSVVAEVEALAAGLGVDSFVPLAIDSLLEATIEPAIAQIPSATQLLVQNLTGELRVRLARGDRMAEITKALYGKGADGGIFGRGLTSARLMAHRAVSESENTARLLFLQDATTKVDGLQKQAVARIDGDTSKTCLAVHGQIQPVGMPFDLRGGFGRAQAPPFHWGPCRTTVTGYHRSFEDTSGLTTAGMRKDAAAQAKANN